MITSTSNPTIKEIRALRQRREREASGRCFVEGIRLVGEAVQLGAAIELLVVAPELLESSFAQELVAQQARAGVPLLEVSAKVFTSLTQRDGPQGLGAVVRTRWELLDSLRLTGTGVVALDAVADPGNLGTILRTADATGCAGVILLGEATDPYDPTALRSSMGAIFNLGLARASFAELVAWKERHNYLLVGSSGTAPHDYRAANYRLPLILLMGSERQGLSKEQLNRCDLTVNIPMAGRSDSLNLAVATGVILYELFYRHKSGGR